MIVSLVAAELKNDCGVLMECESESKVGER
jgi:hypothetical protein